jgi:sulfate adenylyltransferase subunit 1
LFKSFSRSKSSNRFKRETPLIESSEHSQTELLRFITCGSVDDGKSTLIGRLLHDSKSIFEDQLAAVERSTRRRGVDGVDLSLLTDGLQAEREQGITIDVAYRYFATPKRKFIIADTPGHEQYTRNMVTGASTANLAVILMDARKGVLIQSRRHAYIANLLRIPHLLVAVNKMDLVDYSREVFCAIREAFAEYAARLSFRDVIYIPISALNGAMVVERSESMPWYDGPTLLDLLESIEIDRDENLDDFRFPVQWVCRPSTLEDHDFRGYMGRIASGTVKAGDAVTVLPSGRSSRVKRIVTFDGEFRHAFAPQSVTLLLEDDLDVSRGDMIVKDRDSVSVTNEYRADICWLSEQPLDTRRKYLVKHATKTVKVWLTRIEHRVDVNTSQLVAGLHSLQMNDIARVGIKGQQPLVIDSYARNRATGSFIIIDEITNNTVGAGMIV